MPDAGGQGLLADFDVELETVFGVSVPESLQLQVHAGREFGQVAHDGG